MGLSDLPSLLTVEEAADFLRIDVLTAFRAVIEGELPLVVSGGCRLVDTTCLLLELGIPVGPSGAGRLRMVEHAEHAHPQPSLWSADECWKGAS